MTVMDGLSNSSRQGRITPGERHARSRDDETFLMGAEKVMERRFSNESSADADLDTAMNEQLVWDQARALAAAATRAFDKRDPGPPGVEVLRPNVLAVSDGSEPPIDEFVEINRRGAVGSIAPTGAAAGSDRS